MIRHNLASLWFALLLFSFAACSGGSSGTPVPSASAASHSVSKDGNLALTLLGTPGTAGNPLAWSITSPPQHGSLSGTAPNLTFTPTTGYLGTDTFEFAVIENGISSAPARVELLIIDWTDISPSGGLVATAAFHPSRANELWVSSDDGGGLYKSVDTGSTWTLQKNTPLNWSTYSLVFDPSNSSALYAPNHFGRGMLKSTDGGVTWANFGAGLPDTGEQAKRIDDLAVDPGNGSRVWAATRSGLYRSTDAGLSFSKVGSTTFGAETDFRAVEISATGRVFVASKNGGLYDSQDGGGTWTVIAAPSGLLPSDLAVTTNAVYIAFGFGWIARATGYVAANYAVINDPTMGGIRSTAWTRIEAVSGASVVQDQLYVGTTWVAASTQWGFHHSTDGGASFTKKNTGLDGASVFDLVVDPSKASRLIYTSVNDGVFLTTNAGTQWTSISVGMQAYDSLALAEDPNDGNHILFTSGAAFPGTSKTLETINGGQTWSEIAGLANLDLLEIRFVPGSSTQVLATTHNTGLYRTMSGVGATWSQVITMTTSLRNLEFSPVDNSRVYATASNPVTHVEAGVYYSSDTGATWARRFTNDVPANVLAFGVLPHPSQRDEVLLFGTDLWVSTDALATGKAGIRSLGLAAFAPGKLFNSARFHPQSATTVLVGTATGELYKTSNYSATGTPTWSAIPTIAKDALINDILIRVDTHGETWLLSLWNGDASFLPTSTTGVLRSEDQGNTWTFLDAGLYPCNMVWKLRWSSASPRSVLVGLWGAAGFYRLDF